MPESEFRLVMDAESFDALSADIVRQIKLLGDNEAERRLGFPLDEITRGLIETLPGNEPGVVLVRPSARMLKIRELLIG
jgi:hypothetical protein